MVRKLALVFATSCLMLWTIGCAGQQHTRSAQYTNFSAAEGAAQHPLCKFGMPERTRGWQGGPTRIVARAGYVLEHSSVDRIPVWVCEHVLPTHFQKNANRQNRFAPDPELPKGQRAELSDYRGSGYDRGHNAPAGDFDYSQARKDESFYLSNMCPQVGPGFNQSIWRVLEDRARDVVRNRGEAFIITGSLFWDPAEDDLQTADGLVDYFVIGPGDVAVPTHCYKIIVAPEQHDSTHWQAIGFVLENAKHPRQNDRDRDFTAFVKPIDWIEDHLGINFMPQLDDENPALEQELERAAPAMWPEFRAQR